jgi:hypothetical protein
MIKNIQPLKIVDTAHFQSTREFLEWIFQHGMLRRPMCCNKLMNLQGHTASSIDGHTWRCIKCKKRQGIRRYSFFSKFREMSLMLLFEIVFNYFANGLSEIFTCNKLQEAGIYVALDKMQDIFKTLRLCISNYLKQTEYLFLPGSCVAIDQAHFFTDFNDVNYWILGVILMEDESYSCYSIVTDKSPKSLLPVLELFVMTEANKKSTIVTDDIYEDLADYGYIHKPYLNHPGFSLKFPCSDLVENSWISTSTLSNPSINKYTKENLELLLAEAILRRRCVIRQQYFHLSLKNVFYS